jgi:pSer/pThr/pTyr-binding forkhead associated (FHA) protein
MKDGHTIKLPRGESLGRVFLASHKASLVIVEGGAAGAEYEIHENGVTVGRGPGVDIAVQDDAMSKTHAAFEPAEHGVRVRDMGSTNGIAVNGSRVDAADLKHGDRIEIGSHVFQFVLESSESVPTYDLNVS